MINQILSIEVSWFDSITNTHSSNQETIRNILYGIYSGGKDRCLKSRIAAVRAEPDQAKRRILKQTLPVIMWQGLFSERSKKGLQSLSGIMCIDIDHKSDNEIEYLKNILNNLPWIIAYFRSPSGDGLKVLVKTTVSNTIDYEKCYCQLIDYFLSELGCKVDESCKEYSKACYASFDPDIYVAQDIEDFPYNPKYDSLNVSTVTVTDTDNHSEYLIPEK